MRRASRWPGTGHLAVHLPVPQEPHLDLGARVLLWPKETDLQREVRVLLKRASGIEGVVPGDRVASLPVDDLAVVALPVIRRPPTATWFLRHPDPPGRSKFQRLGIGDFKVQEASLGHDKTRCHLRQGLDGSANGPKPACRPSGCR